MTEKEQMLELFDNIIEFTNKIRSEIHNLDDTDENFQDLVTLKMMRWAKKMESMGEDDSK